MSAENNRVLVKYLGIILTAAAMLIAGGAVAGRLENRSDVHDQQILDHERRIQRIEVVNQELTTELKNIRELLQEVRADVKSLKQERKK